MLEEEHMASKVVVFMVNQYKSFEHLIGLVVECA